MSRNPLTLNSKQARTDCLLDNESNYLFLSSAACQQSVHCTPAGLAEAASQKKLIVQTLDQDDGIAVRVVMGKLKKQEDEEWIERGSRIMDLTDGAFVVAGGNVFVSDQSSKRDLEDDEDCYQMFMVRPDHYLITVYTHAPSPNGFRLTHQKDWPGFLPYFQSTRPRKKFPGWLIEYANLTGEDLDEIPEKKIAADEDIEERVQFVIQLTRVPESPTLSPLKNGYILETESRLPTTCPLGIVPVGFEVAPPSSAEEKRLERLEAKELEERFSDPQKLAASLRPFAESLFQKDIAAAAQYFIPELRQAAHQYMDRFRKRRSRWEPLEDVWLDKEESVSSIKSWTSNFDSGGNLFAPGAVQVSNYLGDLRCEFGNGNDYVKGKIRCYLIVDAAVIATAEGPRLAGIYFSY